MATGFNPFTTLASGVGGLASGLFTDASAPYTEASKQFQNYGKLGASTQSPFYYAGTNALGGLSDYLNQIRGSTGSYQQWLNQMQNPTEFINNMMGQYQESPWAHYQQQQAMRAGQAMGSAGGLTGSTPLMQFAQQNARDISSQDMNQWLQHVLGINSQYGAGEAGLSGTYGQGIQNLTGMGSSAANALTNLYGDLGKSMAEASYGEQAGKNQNKSDLWGGLFNTGLGLASMFL